MDKKTRKELERLQNLTNAEKNLLGDLYGELFGSLVSDPSKRRDEEANSGKSTETVRRRSSVSGAETPVRRKSGEPSAAELLDQVRKKHPNPVDDARKALQEAKDLMSRTDELSQEITDSNRKRMEELAGMMSDLGQIDPSAMNPDGTPQASQSANKPAVQTATGVEVKAQEEAPKEPETDPMEELDGLVGLTTIKHDVKELMAFVKIQKMREEAGLKAVPVSLHLVFTGNPGTGKTTVARIIARLYKQIGVLQKGQLIEVDRSGLVAGYVGQTALKTQEQIQKALGGVLFIDEAYALAQKDDAFGQEAINTLLKAMEDHRKDLVVIVAGYTKPMEKFIDSNPGLKSRFNKYIEFPDYTIDELMEIFELNCKKYDYVIEEDAKKQVRARLVSKKMQMQENFANAREVRNMFEDIITNQARRVAAMENPTHDDMMKITIMDLTDDIGEVIDSKEVEKMEAAAKNLLTTPVLELHEEEKPDSGDKSAAGAVPENSEAGKQESGTSGDVTPAADRNAEE